MNALDTPSTYTTLPKVELHRHLEGAVRLTTLLDVAAEYGVTLPESRPEALRRYVQVVPNDPHTSAHFLSKFAVLRRFFVSEAVIRRIVAEAIEDAARDNVCYMELRFTPKALARLMNYSFAQVVEWVCEATEAAQAQHAIRVRLLIAINRHESVHDAEESLAAALAYQGRGVVGIDLCGQEKGYPATPFLAIFKVAREAGLGVTMHAGEWDTPENIAQAVDQFGATRIGHGVRILENSNVIKLCRTRGVTFEVCPTSNLHSGVFARLDLHPLRDMRSAGLLVTLNTDDPAICSITLSDEYATAHEVLRLPQAALREVVQNAINAAFLPREERAALRAQIESAWERVPDAARW